MHCKETKHTLLIKFIRPPPGVRFYYCCTNQQNIDDYQNTFQVSVMVNTPGCASSRSKIISLLLKHNCYLWINKRTVLQKNWKLVKHIITCWLANHCYLLALLKGRKSFSGFYVIFLYISEVSHDSIVLDQIKTWIQCETLHSFSNFKMVKCKELTKKDRTRVKALHFFSHFCDRWFNKFVKYCIPKMSQNFLFSLMRKKKIRIHFLRIKNKGH